MLLTKCFVFFLILKISSLYIISIYQNTLVILYIYFQFSLPLPKGGKHANNPVLFEDQPLPQQRTTKKSKQKLDVFDPDYVAGCSPFIIKDITSRASQLGIKNARNGQFNKRNPNEVRKKYGRRKQKLVYKYMNKQYHLHC